MNKKFLKISALISLMLIFSFTACEMGATVESPAQYTVTFNANYDGASPATGSQTFTAGTAQALKSVSTLGFSRSGYTFAGWATSSDASSAAYADGASYTATADVTLYAVWTVITYTVTF
ncbi:MAG: InlB B-repeat-containing protein, partial [Treponema sp.]|nr:InlB B-repeat-containing protein [Treponema sp.]